MSTQQQHAWKSLSITSAALCLLFGASISAFSQQTIKPEDQEISLVGTIRLVHGFGPPGYGEDPKHDAHVSYWALEVPVPINTPCTPTKPEYAKDECGSSKRLKLFFNGLELTKLADLPAAKWRDGTVIVRGKLHRADTMGEMTPIYVVVSHIQAPTPTGEPALCNYAKVYRLAGGAKLNVHSAATIQSPEIDSLPNGTVVYICDEIKDWVQIFYGGIGKPCKAGTSEGLPETQRRDCHSGWVQQKWINVISG
jgi:hypothetical protein